MVEDTGARALGRRTARKRRIVNGECRLCGQRRQLCRSHIIPEWAYRPLYDEDRRSIEVSSEDLRQHIVQVGLREHLFCCDCERHFERIERPFLRFWGARSRFPAILNQPSIGLSGIDYENTRKLLLSVIWRAHVAAQPALSAVQLGPHAEKLRRILQSEPGAATADDYPIYGCLLRDPATNALVKFVVTPAKTRIDGHWGYVVAFLGCYWQVFVSRAAPRLRRSCMLKHDGTMVLPVMNFQDVGALRGLFRSN